MMMLFRIMVLTLNLIVMAGPATASPAISPRLTENALLAAENELFAAEVHHDVAAIQRGFATEANFVHANGMVQTKAEYIQAMRDSKFPIRAITATDRVVRLFGTIGIVRGTKVLDVGDMHLSGTYLAVYVLRDGRWQMLDQQSSPALGQMKDGAR
ncbi:nuclear transport factor 2 family protein [Novosphingobium umbonatum]|uniref:Nuclear transport factor 2 family protein n=1 Tax=Novosphingobium umbonatum TaxID=1908524 RepID=A0A3S2WZZ3_9SPHN|nr:nuclear transport factor 2 family protein [Novosphingobium umbonatum]RVU02176.1 nuclear transport factor 2 family protein [Novosphingobium umbonatum]